MCLACMNGNEIMVTYLCEQGADVKLVDKELHSLIHWITGRMNGSENAKKEKVEF